MLTPRISRRERMLGWIAAGGVAVMLAGCAATIGDASSSPAASSTGSVTSASSSGLPPTTLVAPTDSAAASALQPSQTAASTGVTSPALSAGEAPEQTSQATTSLQHVANPTGTASTGGRAEVPADASAGAPTGTATGPGSSPPTGLVAPTAGAVAVTAADRSAAVAAVALMSLSDRAASVIMVTGKQAIGTRLLAKHHFAGVILFAPGKVVDGTRNGTPAQVAAVTAALRADAARDPAGAAPLIATDQEYGAVQRLRQGFTTFPSAAQLGSISDTATAARLTSQVAAAAAAEMRAVGVTVDFAPVFGVTPADGGASAIGEFGRSYGSDPQKVAALVAAAVTGYQSGGVVAGLKHFPGLARIASDSHVTLPTLNATCADWNAHEAIPAQAGVDSGALMVMTGHVLMPAVGDTKLPASIDPPIVQKLLKGNGISTCRGMGFDGVAVTDSLQMAPVADHYGSGAAAVAALTAGEDLLLMPADPVAAAAGIVAAVTAGTLAASRLADAATSVLALRMASARVANPPLSVVGSAAHGRVAAAAFAAAR